MVEALRDRLKCEQGRTTLPRLKDEIIAISRRAAALPRLTGRSADGKGPHAAALNLGDCFSYALSRSTGEPLLCKGEDFPRTDVARCLLP